MMRSVFIIPIQLIFLAIVMAQQSIGMTSDIGSLPVLGSFVYSTTPPMRPQCLLWSQLISRRDDYTYTPGIGGHKLHTRAVSWNEARTTCEEEGGHLAIINSIAEANVITEIFKNGEAITGSPHPDFAIIGFHDLFSEGQFVTIHGQTLARAGFTQWAGGQPDNAGGAENCGSLHKSGRLNDVHCGTKFGFICEMPLY